MFATLSDGWLYSNWVVGTSHMRAVEAEWPAAGSRLHHCLGHLAGGHPGRDGRRGVASRTVACVLTAKGGVLGAARVVLELEAVRSRHDR